MKIAIMSSKSGDWYGLYINGELKYENHSISAAMALILLKEAGLQIDISDIPMPVKAERNGRCPKSIVVKTK